MSRYFFDVENGGLSVDHDGLALPDQNGVPRAALQALFDMAALERIDSGNHAFTIAVRDEAGSVVYRASVTIDAHWTAETLPPLRRLV